MNDVPGLNFALGEDIDMLRDSLANFAAKEIAPRAAEIDKTDQFPMDLWKKFGDLGVLGMTVSEEYGGAIVLSPSAASQSSCPNTSRVKSATFSRK